MTAVCDVVTDVCCAVVVSARPASTTGAGGAVVDAIGASDAIGFGESAVAAAVTDSAAAGAIGLASEDECVTAR